MVLKGLEVKGTNLILEEKGVCIVVALNMRFMIY